MARPKKIKDDSTEEIDEVEEAQETEIESGQTEQSIQESVIEEVKERIEGVDFKYMLDEHGNKIIGDESPKVEETSSVPELKVGAVEVVWLDPYQVRLPKTGLFVERIGSDVVFETDDGKQWAIPFRAEHARLKNGDKFTF